MAIFSPKPWVNPSGKNLNFSTFWTCCFHGLERRFFVLENCKTHFPALYCKKKKDIEKWPFFDQNHELTPLEKSQFFDFLNFFFYGLERRFYVLEYCKTHFPGLYCLKKEMEKWPFFGQNHGLTPLEKSHFFDFFYFLFL